MDSDRERSLDSGSEIAGHPGTIIEVLPSGLYRVRLDERTAQVVAHIADRIGRNFIRLLVGDRVRIELSPVDVGRGRIVEKL